MSISSSPNPARLRTRLAFTLVETIAMIVVLAVALPPTLFSIREAALDRAGPVMASRARWLATAKLEDVIADRHSSSRGYDYLLSANYPSESSVTGFSDFARAVTLSETEADLVTPGEGCMIVTVTVTWSDPRSGPRSLAIATVLTEYGT
jgi:hypothetical protein